PRGRPGIWLGLSRFPRFRVAVLQDPARLVGADREEGEIERAEPPRDFPPMRAVARVPGEQDPAPAGLDQQPAPQRAVAVEHAARREMLSGRQGDRERRGARALPPIDFLHLTTARRSEQPAVPARWHLPRLKATPL